MKHRNCGGQILLVATDMFELVSPSMNITIRGIYPGIMELTSKKGGSYRFKCSSCGKNFTEKDEYDEEFIQGCGICGREKPPSELLVSEHLPVICKSCAKGEPIERKSRNDKVTTTINFNESILSMYAEYLKNANLPTLLLILTKKILKGDYDG